MGIPRLYLVTDHTAFYERYGWTFLTMVTGTTISGADVYRPHPAPRVRRPCAAGHNQPLTFQGFQGINVRCYFL